MSDTEEVVGKCGPGQISPNDLDNSYVFVSDEDDSGKGIHFQKGEDFTTKPDDGISSEEEGVKLSSTINSKDDNFKGEVVEIADNEGEGLGLGAESNDGIAAANGECVVGPDAKLSGSSMSNPINKEDADQFLLGGEAADANNQQTEEVDELPPKEVVNQVAEMESPKDPNPINAQEKICVEEEEVKFNNGEVPEEKPMNTDEEKMNLELQDVAAAEDEVKLSEAEVVENVAECDLQDTAEVLENAGQGSLILEANPENTKDDADANVDERETRDASATADDDEIKLSEGEVVQIAEHEDVDLELNPNYTKDQIDADASVVVEHETRDVSAKADDEVKLSEGVVVENAEESDPVNTKETIFAVANVVEQESQAACLKVEPEIKLSREVVAEHENLDLESNSVNTNEETNAAAKVVELESLDSSVKAKEDEVKFSGEVVENAEQENLNLELNPVNANEEINAASNVVELESLDSSVKAEEDEVKLLGELVENAEHENFNLVNVNEEINASTNVVELESLDSSVKGGEDEVKKLCEVVENAEQENLNLESKSVNANEEIVAASNVLELESLDSSVKAEEDNVKLSGEVVENGEREILNLESNPVNALVDIDATADFVELDTLATSVKAKEDKSKLSGEVVENGESEILNLESNPVNAFVEIAAAPIVVELESQDTSMKAEEDNVKLSLEVVENAAEREILNLESNPANSNEEIDAAANVVELESLDTSVKVEEDKVKLLGEVVENAEREILNLDSNPVKSNEKIDAAANVVELESLDTSVKAEEDKVKLSGEVVENAKREILNSELNDVDANEEIDVGANVVELESLDMSLKVEEDMVKLSGEVVENAGREILNLELNHVNSNEEIDAAVNVVELESLDTSVKAKEDKVKLSGEVVENAEREILNFALNDDNANEEVDAAGNVVELESLDMSSKAEEDKVKLSSEVIAEHDEVPSATSYSTLEPEVGVPTFSAIISSENSSDADKGNNTELEIESVEDKVDQIDAENLVLRDNDDNGNSQDNNTPVDPPRVKEASIKIKRKPFNFLIKVPRFDNESLREQIRLAKINVDEKTKLRDSIQVQIQEKRASTQVHGIAFEYAKGESRNARKLVRLKRVEIDSLQSVINKAKNALSIGDIDRQMYNMEHMIQHETLPLKEEKQLIREIKQLKLLREQLSSNMGSKDEIKQALEQREEVEERLKILRKDLDLLKGKVVKAEAAALEAQKKYDAENKEVKEIQAQFRAADGVRQEAYVQWQSLRKELSKKSEYFYKYKDDSAVANNCVFSRDMDSLYRLCTNNVEKFMELWNTNDEFRRDYVKFNTRSTVWRLGTLDGRSLGPDEVPPVLPSYVDKRVNRNVSTPAKVDLKSQFPTLEPKHVKTTESVISDGQSTKKSTDEKKQRAADKEPAKSVQSNGPDTVSGQDIIINEVREEPKKSKEEIEAINKVEERERKEAEAKLKEERRLEALAKASEARERKKKQAEKLQMRAELKTIKEAEQKEKEREKRLRKKERKKVTATDVNDTNGSEIAPSSESAAESTSKDVEVKDSSSAAAPKKLKKHWWFGKQSKAKSNIHPPIRNRNKKKLQQWMWVGITSCFIFVMFVMGNMGVFSNVHFRRRIPVA